MVSLNRAIRFREPKQRESGEEGTKAYRDERFTPALVWADGISPLPVSLNVYCEGAPLRGL